MLNQFFCTLTAICIIKIAVCIHSLWAIFQISLAKNFSFRVVPVIP